MTHRKDDNIKDSKDDNMTVRKDDNIKDIKDDNITESKNDIFTFLGVSTCLG